MGLSEHRVKYAKEFTAVYLRYDAKDVCPGYADKDCAG